MTPYNITLLPGDGIGPEITEATLKVLEATGIKFNWDRQLAGQMAIDASGDVLPQATQDSLLKNKIALKGPIGTPIAKGFKSVNVLIRKKFDLYANVRPVKSISGVESHYNNINMVIVRENTEDLYSGIEHEVAPGVVECIKVITEKASSHIARYAFDYSKKHGRKKVTAIHKANIMKLSDGLFLDCCRKVAKDYPDIEYQEMIVDNTCMQMVLKPHQFDVMVLENLYGDIVSDLAAGLIGGLGVVPGANIGEELAVFEAVHGNAPDIAGKGIANPTALILTARMMLEHLGEQKAADAIWKAINAVFRKHTTLTRDMGGEASTMDYAKAVAEEVAGIMR